MTPHSSKTNDGHDNRQVYPPRSHPATVSDGIGSAIRVSIIHKKQINNNNEPQLIKPSAMELASKHGIILAVRPCEESRSVVKTDHEKLFHRVAQVAFQ